MFLKDFLANHPVWSMILGPLGGAILNDFLRLRAAGDGQSDPWTAAWKAYDVKKATWQYANTIFGSVLTMIGITAATAGAATVAIWLLY